MTERVAVATLGLVLGACALAYEMPERPLLIEVGTTTRAEVAARFQALGIRTVFDEGRFLVGVHPGRLAVGAGPPSEGVIVLEFDADVVRRLDTGAPPALEGWMVSTKALHGDHALSVAFSPDGRFLAAGGGENRRVLLWDLTGPGDPRVWSGDRWCRWPVRSVAFSPDGRLLTAGGIDGIGVVWETTTGREVTRLQGHGDSSCHLKPDVAWVAISPDGASLAAGGLGTVSIRDTATWRERRRVSGDSVAFSPDGQSLATGNVDGSVAVWDLETGAELGRRPSPMSSPVPKRAAGIAHLVPHVSYSPDGTLLAINYLRFIEVRRVVTGGGIGEVVAVFAGPHKGFVVRFPGASLAFSPDGRRLAAVSDVDAMIWDFQTSRVLWRSVSVFVQRLAFSPDGRTVATAGPTGVHLWRVLDTGPARP